jgi:guanylate kinase
MIFDSCQYIAHVYIECHGERYTKLKIYISKMIFDSCQYIAHVYIECQGYRYTKLKIYISEMIFDSCQYIEAWGGVVVKALRY